MKQGKLIVIEGAIDGIGKTTQYNMLYDRLTKDGEKMMAREVVLGNGYKCVAVSNEKNPNEATLMNKEELLMYNAKETLDIAFSDNICQCYCFKGILSRKLQILPSILNVMNE